MKTNYKSFIPFISSILGLALMGLWIFLAKEPLNSVGYLILGISIFLIALGIYFKVQRFRNEKSGLKADDELSERIKEKATSKAFYISFYIWFFIILFVKRIDPEIKIIMGFGLLSMGLAFFINWLYYSKVGIANENKN